MNPSELDEMSGGTSGDCIVVSHAGNAPSCLRCAIVPVQRGGPMVDAIRRKLLKTGAATAAMAATSSLPAQQSGTSDSGRFYQRGKVRIRYEETGAGFPLLLIAGGGVEGATTDGLAGGDRGNS